MTWIKTISLDEADEKLRRAMLDQRPFYPVKYSTPVHPTADGIESHAEFLRRVTLDGELVKALEEDYRSAPIREQDRVMLDYVVQVTKDATRISPADHERLREVGFNDQAILQITLIASWFNYINRVADALGVGRD